MKPRDRAASSGEAALGEIRAARSLHQASSSAADHRQAAERLRGAIQTLDTATQPGPAFEAFLLLARVLEELASGGETADREPQLNQALACVHAADHLAGRLEDPGCRMRQKRQHALILAARFRPDRDENLLDAIALAGAAIRRYELDPESDAEDHGSLLVATGNAWLKVRRGRTEALERACACFRAGRAAVDADALPRLAQVLEGNLAMTEQLLAAEDHALPDKEMVGRFDARIQGCVERGDLHEAIQNGWSFLQWAWSFPTTPNIHVGAAHKILGGLHVRNGDMAEAEMHLYSSLAVFSAVLRPGEPEFPLLEQTRRDLEQFFEASDQSEKTEAATAQASRAVVRAGELTRRAAARLETEPEAARADLDDALRLLPTSPDALFYRGVSGMMAGDDAPAQADFSAALMFRPRHLPSLGNRFTVRLRLGDLDGALADCDAILELDPEHDAALYHRARLRSGRQDWEGAVADLDRFLEIHPESVESLVLRAAAKEQTGDVAGALDDLVRAKPAYTEEKGRRKLEAKLAELRARTGEGPASDPDPDAPESDP